MTKRHYFLLTCAAVCFAATLFFEWYTSSSANLNRYAASMQQTLQAQEKEIQNLFEDTVFFNPFFDDSIVSNVDIKRLQKLSDASYTVLFFQGDSLLFWSNNRVAPLRNLSQNMRTDTLLSLVNGYYTMIVGSYSASSTIMALIPVRYNYARPNNLFKNEWALDESVPSKVSLSQTKTNYPILSSQNKTVCYLAGDGPLRTQTQQFGLLALYLLLAIFLLLFIDTVAQDFLQKYSPTKGIVFLLVSTIVLRLLSFYLNLSAKFDELPIFHQNNLSETIYSNSLGDILINICLLLWIIIFFYRETPVVSYKSFTLSRRIVLASINYFAVMFGIVMTVSLHEEMIFNSGIRFDLENVIAIDGYSFLALFCIMLVWFAQFLFSYRLLAGTKSMNLTNLQRLVGVFIAFCVLLIPLLALENLHINLMWLFTFTFCFILGFDFFLDTSMQLPLLWAVIWIIFCSFCSSILLNIYKKDLDEKVIKNYIRQLGVQKKAIFGDAAILPTLSEDERLNINILPDYLQDSMKIQVAIFLNGKNINEDKHDASSDDFYLQVNEALKPGEWSEKVESDYIQASYCASKEKTIIAYKIYGGRKKIVYLFSYLFTMLSGMIFAAFIINTFLGGVIRGFVRPTKPSMRFRVQFWVLALIVSSYILVGAVTLYTSYQNADKVYESLLHQKLKAVQSNIEHDINLSKSCNVSTLADIADSVGVIHNIELSLYDTVGNLINLAQKDIIKDCIINTKINPVAQHVILYKEKNSYFQAEKLGKESYQAGYAPIWDPISRKLVAIATISNYHREKIQVSDASDFIGAILSVYVLMLIVAIFLSHITVNVINAPITEIGDKLSSVKLGMPNERLPWDSEDELGDLIKEYNQMITKLEASTIVIKQSERESAWREMAKQVAHEIKNPLTPMKLSIQYLEYQYQNDPENTGGLIKRISKTLLEQIENMAQIANEFANYAKMPKTENKTLVINDLVHDTYSLFMKEERDDIEVKLFLPTERIVVFTDKNQMSRVVLNLIKNATQAIPEDRAGEVRVSLSLKNEKTALISVQDNGEGIHEDFRQKVFMPSFTTKRSGTGLGLAMCKNIVTGAGGEIYFHTTFGEGSEFCIELPVEEVY
jgi:signal transduction histidine kinase